MANKVWRWIKKAFLLNITLFFVQLVVFITLGITIVGLNAWIRLHPFLTFIIFVLVHLILEGFLIEWVNKNKWANR